VDDDDDYDDDDGDHHRQIVNKNKHFKVRLG
jgi:hypothetical protein